MPRTASPIDLSAQEREKLELIAGRPKSSQRDAMRARIILLCAEQRTNTEIADLIGSCVQTVGKWRERFAADRIAGLADAPRSGAPRTISDKKVEEVLTKTLEEVPGHLTHWSRRKMARETGIGQTSVGRIWRAFGVKPHVMRGFKLSKDPMFTEKVRDVVGLYLNPPENAIVLSVDEKSQCQALERAQPVLPMDLGRHERQTHDYIEHHNENPIPFIWTATPEKIFDKLSTSFS